MARNVSLTQLLTDVRSQADIVGATLRHTDTELTRFLNQAIQRFRERVSAEGSTHYLVAATGNFTVGATSPYQFQTLDLSSLNPALVRSFGIDITVNNVSHSLLHIPFTHRGNYAGPSFHGVPVAWAHFRRDQVAIFPPPDSTYAYVVWYLPVLADLVNPGDNWDGAAGWEDYLVWDVTCRVCIRDTNTEAYAMAKDYRDSAWSDILRSATKVTQAGGGVIGRDTMGERLRTQPRRRILPLP